MALSVENVSYKYETGTAMEVEALHDVSTYIPDGQFIGLIGHTGSGKSTFVQLLNGLLTPSSGRILYNGTDIASEGFSKKMLRSKVGLVFQYPEHQLFEETLIRDVSFGPRNLGLSEDEISERARNALTMVGLPEHTWEKSPFDLSGGQKRRAAIAGVIAMEPDLLILDEPTAGLDPKGRDEILDMVAGMHADKHISVLLVSHSMDDVARYVQRIMVMDKAGLVFDDTPRKVFSHYSELSDMGLFVPQVTYLMHILKERGIDAKTDVMTVQECTEELMKRFGADGGVIKQL